MKPDTATTAASVPAAGLSDIWGRICNSCQSAPCSVYCHADSAYLCAACDVHIHTANKSASRHDRVHMCEACERAPAAFICKADAASLCTTCDADIHSANPLARRHQRVPINPILGFMYGTTQAEVANHEMVDDEDEDEAASWLLPNPIKNSNNNNEIMFGAEGDEYLEFMEYNSCGENQLMDNYNQQQQQQHYSSAAKAEHKIHGAGDSVVPVKLKEQHQLNFQLGMGYNSTLNHSSISHTVSVSSMDNMGIVPESTMSEMSMSHAESPRSANDVLSPPAAQLSPTDREARVMRYREKKKMRKFEKTIRYASRKAYAETRPRIKGRFAKRGSAEVEFEVDQLFCSSLMAENGYGIVPSF